MIDISDTISDNKIIHSILHENVQKGQFSKELREFLELKHLFNPIRIMILRILDQSNCLSTPRLRKILNIPWGTYNDHIKALKSKNYIELNQEFVDNCPVRTIKITINGSFLYSKFRKLLLTIL